MTAFLLTGGIVSDRMERRKVLIAADLVRALVLARHRRAVAGGRAARSGTSWSLAVLYGAGEAFFGPAFGALVPEIVAPHHLVEANSLEQLVRQACERLLGPAVGGLVVAAVGAGGAFLIDAGHLRHERRMHLAPAGPLAAARPAPSARRAASWARPSPSCARSRGCGRRWSRRRSACCSSSGRSRCCCPSSCATTCDAGAWGYGAILAAAGAGSVRRLAHRQPARAAAALPDLRLRRVDRRHAAVHRLRLRHRRVAAHGLRRRLRRVRDRRHGRVGHARCPRGCRPRCAGACTRWTGSSRSGSRRCPSR